MVDTGSFRIDFDIEGNHLNYTDANTRRARVLARLQARYPQMYVSFTLPGWFYGIDNRSLELVKLNKANGVRVDMFNIMTQSFGSEINNFAGGSLGQGSVITMKATMNQLKGIFGYSDRRCTRSWVFAL